MNYDSLTMFPVGEIQEKWSWKTDIVKARNGRETRYCLMANPRIEWSASYFYDNDANYQNQNVNDYFREMMKAPVIAPMFQYAAQVLQTSFLGENSVKCYIQTPIFYDGMFVVLLDLDTLQTRCMTIFRVDADGTIVFTQSFETDITTRFMVVPCMVATFNTPSINLDKRTSTATFAMSSYIENRFLGKFSTATVRTFKGLPVLDALFAPGSVDDFAFDYQILDNGIGSRDFRTAAQGVKTNGKREFQLNLFTNPGALDYWRKFCSEVKGSYKAFLMSTQRNDYTILRDVELAPRQNDIELIVQRARFPEITELKDIEILYEDGSTSQHRITNPTTIWKYKPGWRMGDIVQNFSYNIFDMWDLPVPVEDIPSRVKFRVKIGGFVTSTPTSTDYNDFFRNIFGRFLSPEFISVPGPLFNNNGQPGFSQGFEGPEEEYSSFTVAPPAGSRYIETNLSAVYFSDQFFNQSEPIFEYIIDDGAPVEVHTLYDYQSIRIDPRLPDDPKVKRIKSISNLLRVRMGDTVEVTHGLKSATVKFDFEMTADASYATGT